ncbi:hypothetical protein H4R33_003715 [Dimargaris cristalligena]|nr:hypothetical protein H4R33_003715 [Dimargaris cristalligena]
MATLRGSRANDRTPRSSRPPSHFARPPTRSILTPEPSDTEFLQPPESETGPVHAMPQLRDIRPQDLPKLSATMRRKYWRWRAVDDPRFKYTYASVWVNLPYMQDGRLCGATTSEVPQPAQLNVDLYRIKDLYRLLRREPQISRVWGAYLKVIQSPNAAVLLDHAFFEWLARVIHVEAIDPERSSGVVQVVDDMRRIHNQRFPSGALLAIYLPALLSVGRPQQVVDTVEHQLDLTETDRGFPLNTRILNYYLRSLLAVGRLPTALTLFNTMQGHPVYPADEFTFTFLIRGLATLGMKREAFDHYQAFLTAFPEFTDSLGFNFILFSFATIRAFDTTLAVLQEMNKRQVNLDDASLAIMLDFISNFRGGNSAFIQNLYHTLADSRAELDGRLLEAFVRNFVQVRDFPMAQKVFQYMRDRGLQPSTAFYGSLIRRLSLQGDFTQCLNVYNRMVQEGLTPTDTIQAYVLNVYMQLDTKKAELYFERVRAGQLQPTIYLYNGLIGGYARAKDMVSVLRVYRSLRDSKVDPDFFTFFGVFQGFCAVGYWRQRQRFPHFGDPNQYSITEHPQPFPATADGFRLTPPSTAPANDTDQLPLSHPRRIYQDMLGNSSIVPTLSLYASILKSFIYEGDLEGCNQAYIDMTEGFHLVPDDLVYSGMIKAFLGRSDYESSADLFDMMRERNIRPTLYLCNALIRGLCRADCVDQAHDIFKWMTSGGPPRTPEQPQPTSTTRVLRPSSVPLGTYILHYNPFTAGSRANPAIPNPFPDHPVPVRPDQHTVEAMVKGFVTSDRIEEAYACIQEMERWYLQPTPSTISYLIKHYARQGQVFEANSLWGEYATAEARQLQAKLKVQSSSSQAHHQQLPRIAPRPAPTVPRNADPELSPMVPLDQYVHSAETYGASEEFNVAALDVQFDRSQIGERVGSRAGSSVQTSPSIDDPPYESIKEVHPIWTDGDHWAPATPEARAAARASYQQMKAPDDDSDRDPQKIEGNAQ